MKITFAQECLSAGGRRWSIDPQHGGWSEALSARRKGEKAASDQRILGSGASSKKLWAEAGQKAKEILRTRREEGQLGRFAPGMSRKEKVAADEIRGERGGMQS